MSAIDDHAKVLVPSVKAILGQAIERATEEVIREATQAFEKRLRAEIGKAAIDVSSFYELARGADNLVLTVKIKDRPQ